MKEYLSVGDVARILKCSPRVVSNLFYRGYLDKKPTFIAGGVRMIPLWYLPLM